MSLRQDGGGWCAYSDIFLAIRQLRRASGGRVRRFMIIDLDVHQVCGCRLLTLACLRLLRARR